MANFMEFLRKSAKFKCDIHIKIDEDKEEAFTATKQAVYCYLQDYQY